MLIIFTFKIIYLYNKLYITTQNFRSINLYTCGFNMNYVVASYSFSIICVVILTTTQKTKYDIVKCLSKFRQFSVLSSIGIYCQKFYFRNIIDNKAPHKGILIDK